MIQILHNPVYNALCSGDKHLALGNNEVKFFEEQVSPFAGFEDNYNKGFNDLYELLPAGRKILYANPGLITPPGGWQMINEIKGLQFIYEPGNGIKNELAAVVPLGINHVRQMLQLAAFTKPGPFGLRTIDFGAYYGIFDGEKLVAMAGQRLHVQNYTEISAVCTHPDYTGKGYAYGLLIQLIRAILQQGQHPFLHVREDNKRAISLYQRIGFKISRPMYFYFMRRE